MSYFSCLFEMATESDDNKIRWLRKLENQRDNWWTTHMLLSHDSQESDSGTFEGRGVGKVRPTQAWASSLILWTHIKISRNRGASLKEVVTGRVPWHVFQSTYLILSGFKSVTLAVSKITWKTKEDTCSWVLISKCTPTHIHMYYPCIYMYIYTYTQWK